MDDATVLKDLLAQEQAAMDPYFGQSDPATYVSHFTPDATYFDPNSSGKLVGPSIGELFGSYAGQIPAWRYEIIDPAVQVNGDTAVFTFNLDTFDADDGSVTSRWNTTEVHIRAADGWKLIHAHWSHRSPAA